MPNAIKFLYDGMIQNDAVLSIGGWEDVDDSGNLRKCRKVKKCYDSYETLKSFFDEKYFKAVIWGKLYKKDVIGNFEFDKNLCIAEDVDFLYRILKNVNRTVIDTTNIIYQYRVRQTSAMRAKYDSKFEDEIELTEKMIEDVKHQYPELEKYAIRRYQRVNVSCLGKYYRENGSLEGVKHLIGNIRKYNNNLELKYNIRFLLLVYCRPLLKLIIALKK